MRNPALLDALAVLFPVECSGCGAPDRAVCAACAARLAPRPRRHLVRRAGGLGGPDAPDMLPVWSAADYRGTVRRVMLAFKDAGRTDAAPVLARMLEAALSAALADSAVGPRSRPHLATIPSTRSAFRARGYGPVPLVAARAGLRPERILALERQTADQAGLDAGARAANRIGSLRARRALTGTSWVVVDDILTTGATLREAARAIAAAGGEVVAAAVIARTPRHGEGPAAPARDTS